MYPLPPCIFVIAVELLAVPVRHNVKMKGITENCVEKRQFANDTALIIAAEDESLGEAVIVIDNLDQISGLGMNTNKDTIVRLGSVTHLDFKILSGEDFIGQKRDSLP